MTALAVFSVVLCVINVALWIILFLNFRSRFSPRHILSEIRVEVDKLITEISREADRDISLLEGRIRGLKSLIEEADRHITLSHKESSRRKSEEKTLSDLTTLTGKQYVQKELYSSDVSPVSVIPRNAAADRYRQPQTDRPSQSANAMRQEESAVPPSRKNPEVYSGMPPMTPKADSTRTYSQEASGSGGLQSADNEMPGADVPSRPQVSAAERQIKPKIPVRDQILAFYRTGFTAEMIAERLSITVAEVELTVSLFTPDI